MKTDKLRNLITAPFKEQRVLNMHEIRDALLGILDHVDVLNGRSDIMREVAEGDMVIVRRGEFNQLQHDLTITRRQLTALYAAVADCEAGRVTISSIRHRQNDFLAQDDEYQRELRRGEFPPAPVPQYAKKEEDARRAERPPPTPNILHAFVLDTTSGLTHTEYRVCKCGLSEFNQLHTREDK